ncbi:hypothetical protein CASFOL_017823 [Castilleja foliolosa]|uniref:Phosphatidylinositol transfer protein N-terminal domain-containing protein n=1 Tax=Castilleja foliolosa TaxID=1961234 RepID=A0ABD3D9T8_9LAMI
MAMEIRRTTWAKIRKEYSDLTARSFRLLVKYKKRDLRYANGGGSGDIAFIELGVDEKFGKCSKEGIHYSELEMYRCSGLMGKSLLEFQSNKGDVLPPHKFGTLDVVVLKPNKSDLGSPLLGQGVVYRIKNHLLLLPLMIFGDGVFNELVWELLGFCRPLRSVADLDGIRRMVYSRKQQDQCYPVMTAYKLVTIDVPYWGFGSRLEQALLAALFLESHRNCFSWIDEWSGLTLDLMRELEKQSDSSLNQKLSRNCVMLSTKLKFSEVIGAEYGEEFETFRPEGPLKIDVDFLNDRMEDGFLQRIRYAMKPDEAYGLIFSWDNVVVTSLDEGNTDSTK